MSEINEPSLCCLCGNPMPPGEDMFKFHGYSGDCPPKYPPCLPDRKPHRDRVRDISQMMGKALHWTGYTSSRSDRDRG